MQIFIVRNDTTQTKTVFDSDLGGMPSRCAQPLEAPADFVIQHGACPPFLNTPCRRTSLRAGRGSLLFPLTAQPGKVDCVAEGENFYRIVREVGFHWESLFDQEGEGGMGRGGAMTVMEFCVWWMAIMNTIYLVLIISRFLRER